MSLALSMMTFIQQVTWVYYVIMSQETYLVCYIQIYLLFPVLEAVVLLLCVSVIRHFASLVVVAIIKGSNNLVKYKVKISCMQYVLYAFVSAHLLYVIM